ncbi:hypothetical protein [Sodalis glossinidius]|uniref:hypothetical protein n=1 Tax=Sodalis glossinidius TaxID=63612 RepID=UPI0002FC1D54|nr:hypothetical protein [Sodalis glossinidius]
MTPLYLTDRDIDLLDARTKRALLMHNESVMRNCWFSGDGHRPTPPKAQGRESRYRIPGYDSLVDAGQGAAY